MIECRHCGQVGVHLAWCPSLSTLPQPAGNLGERETFEAWAKGEGFVLDRCESKPSRFYLNGHTQDAWRAWQASRLPTATVGDGWVLVPREPTEEMRLHGCAALDSDDYPNDAGYAASCYRAMIAAAPASPPPVSDWLIWSNEHRLWWRPDRCGYTNSVEAAGRYTFAEACSQCDARDRQENGTPSELPVPAPESYAAIILRHAPMAGMTPDERKLYERCAERYPACSTADVGDMLAIISRLAGTKKE